MASDKVFNKGQPFVKKVKKKQVKDELDRLKQAEKKRRRLEKALATSAAIRSELEKKKQKKKEEQQRLDEEGAAIAESVALHVLLDEDSDDSCNIVVNKNNELNTWDCTKNIGIFMGNQKANRVHLGNTKCSLEGGGWLPNSYRSGFGWGGFCYGSSSFSSVPYGRDLYAAVPSFEEQVSRSTSLSAELIAAQAISSLRIAEDAHVDTYLLNGMLRG